MKNIGSIAMLLVAGVGYVASLPAGNAPVNHLEIRTLDNVAHEVLARDPKKNKAAGKSKESSKGEPAGLEVHRLPDDADYLPFLQLPPK